MNLVYIKNIDWVCGNGPEDEKEYKELPKELVVNLSDRQEAMLQDEGPSVEGGLVDLISGHYNWCINQFEYEAYVGESRLPDIDFSEI